jgi:ATP-dependent DNA helicase RecG
VLSKSKNERRKEYRIKPFSVKTAANQSEKFELFNKFNSVPFDDRVNHKAKVGDIHLGHIRDFLVESNSALADEVYSKSIENTLVSLEVANMTDVGVDIRNIALLMFCDYPEKYIPCAQIELAWFNTPEEEGADVFVEKTFTGPLFKQVKDALGAAYEEAVFAFVPPLPPRKNIFPNILANLFILA